MAFAQDFVFSKLILNIFLAEQGYRVLVIEQTETPEQLELRRREKGSKDKVGSGGALLY